MTLLTKPVSRKTLCVVHDKGQREIIVTIQPPAMIGLRARGLRRVVWLDAVELYWMAVKRESVAAQRLKALAKANKAKARKR